MVEGDRRPFYLPTGHHTLPVIRAIHVWLVRLGLTAKVGVHTYLALSITLDHSGPARTLSVRRIPPITSIGTTQLECFFFIVPTTSQQQQQQLKPSGPEEINYLHVKWRWIWEGEEAWESRVVRKKREPVHGFRWRNGVPTHHHLSPLTQRRGDDGDLL
jgi:hypothetical protein